METNVNNRVFEILNENSYIYETSDYYIYLNRFNDAAEFECYYVMQFTDRNTGDIGKSVKFKLSQLLHTISPFSDLIDSGLNIDMSQIEELTQLVRDRVGEQNVPTIEQAAKMSITDVLMLLYHFTCNSQNERILITDDNYCIVPASVFIQFVENTGYTIKDFINTLKNLGMFSNPKKQGGSRPSFVKKYGDECVRVYSIKIPDRIVLDYNTATITSCMEKLLEFGGTIL